MWSQAGPRRTGTLRRGRGVSVSASPSCCVSPSPIGTRCGRLVSYFWEAQPMAIWADEPISKAEEDTLGRTVFATRVAELIETATADAPSIVFGLVGPWGSGKSSVLNLI